MTITYSDFLQTVIENEGEVLATVAGKATFRAEKSGHGVRFIPVSSGKARNVNPGGLQEYLDVFNKTQSLKTTSYPQSMFNPSYVLAVIQLWIGQQQADGPVPPQEEMTETMADLDAYFSAAEGEQRVRSHLCRERSRELVSLAKRVFRANHEQRLFCEVCGFDFSETYGEADFIEAHHRLPLSELEPGTKTKVSDLAMVCANCHRMLHRGNPWPSVAALRQTMESRVKRSQLSHTQVNL